MTPLLLFTVSVIFVTFCLYIINRTQVFVFATKQYHCDSCSFPLKREDMIPLYSWISLRGSCRYCQAPIGYKYLLWDLICLAIIIATSLLLGFAKTLLLLALSVIAITDLKQERIPTLWVVFAGILALPTLHSTSIGLAIGLYACGYLVRQIFDSPPLGRGDVKFLTMTGLWLSVSQVPIFLIITGLGGVLTSLLLRRRLIPLGPSLCIALGVCVIFGEKFDLVKYISSFTPFLS